MGVRRRNVHRGPRERIDAGFENPRLEVSVAGGAPGAVAREEARLVLDLAFFADLGPGDAAGVGDDVDEPVAGARRVRGGGGEDRALDDDPRRAGVEQRRVRTSPAFPPVGDAVAVRVGAGGVGAAEKLLAVGEAVEVRVRPERVGSDGVLGEEVGHPGGVGDPEEPPGGVRAPGDGDGEALAALLCVRQPVAVAIDPSRLPSRLPGPVYRATNPPPFWISETPSTLLTERIINLINI